VDGELLAEEDAMRVVSRQGTKTHAGRVEVEGGVIVGWEKEWKRTTVSMCIFGIEVEAVPTPDQRFQTQ
jgi:hypothetical protein